MSGQAIRKGGPAPDLAVRVLGTLEVSTGGRPVAVTAGRLRTTLVVLAMSAGRTVPVDRLATAVWDPDEEPPDDIRRTLQTYMSRLRSLLGAGSISNRPEGYLLHAEPDRVDALRLDRLLNAAAATPDQAAERTRLVEAAALWRGEPFTGVSSAWLAQSEYPRLVERYLAAVERRIDIDLANGQHNELCAQLSSLTARYPLRETLWVRLLVALARCGRNAEALDRYETIRRRLADELGVDPGPELQQLYADLLAGTSLGPSPAPGPPMTSTIPQQLPADVTGFAGRSGHLRNLDALLRQELECEPAKMGIIAVLGTAGVGKTALVVHWAHQVRDRFPDGQLYVDLRGFNPSGTVTGAAEVLPGFLAALGVAPGRIGSGLDAQIGQYRSVLAGKRALIILDNARDAGQVRPLLPGTPGCLVVVTSRNQLTGLVAIDGAQPVALDLLPADEARTLLANRIGAQRVAAQPRATDTIVARCAGLPLALAIAAARAATYPAFPLSAFATQLDQAAGGLEAFTAGDVAVDIRAVFACSYHGLTSNAARLFRLLGVHPGPDLAVPGAAALAGLRPPAARVVLDELARAHLVTEHVPGRYTFHDLLRAYATELADTHDQPADIRAAMHRMLDHYLHAADAAARTLDPHRLPISTDHQPGPEDAAAHPGDAAAAVDWLSTEHRVLLAAVRQADENGFDAHTWRLAGALVEFLARRGRWHEFADAQRLAVSAAERLADRVGQAHAYHSLGRANGKLRRYDDAHACYRRALELFGMLGDHTGQASAHLGIGWLLGRQRRLREALHHAWEAYPRYLAGGDRAGQANALNAAGWYHAQLGEYSQALVHCRRALTLHSGLADRQGEANTWDSMGYAHHHLGDHQEATNCYRHAVARYREAGDRYGEAETLTRLADTHNATGDPDAARTCWQQAVKILDELGESEADMLRLRLASTPPTPQRRHNGAGHRGSPPAPAGRRLRY